MENTEKEIIEEIAKAYKDIYPNIIFNMANKIEEQRLEIERLKNKSEHK